MATHAVTQWRTVPPSTARCANRQPATIERCLEPLSGPLSLRPYPPMEALCSFKPRWAQALLGDAFLLELFTAELLIKKC